MAEKKNIATGYIGNALRSSAADHVTTFADEIFDTERQQYQNEVNGIVGTYIENPEFLSVKTDAEGRLLWWIEKDGTVNWSKGVPKPIQVKLQELEQKIKDNADDDKTLGERVTANEASIVVINEALDRKVDGVYEDSPEYVRLNKDADERILNGIKADGTNYMPKADVDTLSLNGNKVDNDSVLVNKYVDNPEFIRCYYDTDGRLIWWIENDGTIGWSKGVPQPVQEELKKLEQLDTSIFEKIEAINKYLDETIGYRNNSEYIKVENDNDGRILNAITPIGTNYLPKANIDKLSLEDEVVDNDAVKSHTYTDSSEFINVVKDVDGRVIEATKPDGTKVLVTVETNHLEIPDCLDTDKKYGSEYIRTEIDAEGRLLSGIKTDGSHYIHKISSETIPTEFSEIDDREGRIEIKKDSDGRVISWISAGGVLHECVGLETPIVKTEKLDIPTDVVRNLAENMNQLKLIGGDTNWSGENSLYIPMPRCARVNFTNDNNNAEMPTLKTSNTKMWMEFWDMNGNFFKKRVIANIQGDTSTLLTKKNIAIDICNDEWIGDVTFELKIGDWVAQDSYHLKAGANDSIHGFLAICYKWCEKAIEFLNARPSRLMREQDNTGLSANVSGSLDKDFGTGALCHPDGFPCAVYLNGEFYGVYSWQLKKHRANYLMNKKDYESVILDGAVGPTFFGGTVKWTLFELKNPKTMYCMDGTKYDGDNPKELIDSTSEFYDSSNKDHVNTAKTKKVILDMSQALSIVNAQETDELKKQKFEELFDKEALICFYIMTAAMVNKDSITKNTIWIKYKGHKIAPCFYDLDGAFGHSISGQNITGAWGNPDFLNVDNFPTQFIYRYYKDELDATWKRLVDNNIISEASFKDILYNWISDMGYENYKLENKKWSCPSYRESYINSEYWEYASFSSSTTEYNDTVTYNVGDTVSIDNMNKYMTAYRCKKDCLGIPPCSKLYDTFPYSGGCFETPRRLLNNVVKQIGVLNLYFNY